MKCRRRADASGIESIDVLVDDDAELVGLLAGAGALVRLACRSDEQD
jgi:hypothetical protein